MQPPVIPGHEFIGEVVKLGPGMHNRKKHSYFSIQVIIKISIIYSTNLIGAAEKFGLEIGDHAIAENIVPCWECRYCKRGRYNMCKLELIIENKD